MSSPAAVKQFIAVVELHFPRPKFDGDEMMEAAWVKSLKTVLAGYSDETVAAGAELILRTRNPKRDGRFFPSPSECTEACDKAAAYKKAAETPLLAKPKELTYAERVAVARTVMSHPIGQRAIREGWGESMFHYAMEHGRAPEGDAIMRCKDNARQFRAAYEACLKTPGPLNRALANLAEGMVRKARERMSGEKVA